MRKLPIEHPFFDWMGRIGDWMILNVLFVITSFPVITIGMSATALYKVALRRVRGESRYAAREYFQACREEWKQSTKLWLLFLITGGILLFDILYSKNLWKILNIAIGILAALWCFTFSYAFPLQARFQNSMKNTLLNALLLSFRNLPFTIVIVLLNAVPAVCIVMGEFITMIAMPIFCVIGFSLIVGINSMLFTKIFRVFEEKENENRTEP